MAGGLAMSWRRSVYTFETCLHWLVGSRPGADFHAQWEEIFDIDKLKFIDPEEFVRIETESGDTLAVYTNVDRLETELLRRAPQDEHAIRELTGSIRSLGKFKMLDPAGSLADNWRNLLTDLPRLPLLSKLSKITGKEYGSRFSDPLLRSFFSNGDVGRMSATAMIISLAWMNAGNAGYCIGGAQAIIRLIEERIARLGGKIRYGARVERIVVKDGCARGVELADGKTLVADWVISAADGHTTIFDLLEGRFIDADRRKLYAEMPIFASYLQVSLGVARDLKGQPPMAACLLASPVTIDPGTAPDSVSFRFFHFDPTFAPAGKTAVTCLLPTRNFNYWADLRRDDPVGYHAEKHRVAEMVIAILARRLPGVRASIEVVDVSTPATVHRYTGNWQGTMEGWLPEPGVGFRPLPNTLPGLGRFVMAGQWVLPGGGLPSGPITARMAVKAMCKQDHVPFAHRAERMKELELVGV